MAAAARQNCSKLSILIIPPKVCGLIRFFEEKTRENTRLVDERHQQTAALSKTWLYKVALALLTQLLRSVL